MKNLTRSELSRRRLVPSKRKATPKPVESLNEESAHDPESEEDLAMVDDSQKPDGHEDDQDMDESHDDGASMESDSDADDQ